MRGLTYSKRMLYSLVVLLATVFAWQGCGLTTPEQESPIPDIRNQNKTFYQKTVQETFLKNKQTGEEISLDLAKGMGLVQYDLQTKELGINATAKADGWESIQKTVTKPRRFQCAWAPVSSSGFLSKWFLLHASPVTDHCNVEFAIEEKLLVGKKVSPTESPRDWTTIITIPIEKHYTLERKRDNNGRPTNDTIENSTEHEWSERPSMKLNPLGTTIHSWAYALLAGIGNSGISVEDVVTEEKDGKNYLAFTMVVSGFFGDLLQAKYRFNFLEFESKNEQQFKPTPFNPDNDNTYFSALHLMGRKFDGVTKGFVAGHWDLSGGDNSIELCLYGWPQRFEGLAQDVVNDWNDKFAEIGKGRPLYLNKNRRLRYPIDLRCPSFVWVQDKRKLGTGVLGIGQNNADVVTGETLWGQVIMYGGLMERYIQHYAPGDFSPSKFSGDGRAGVMQNTGTGPFTFQSREFYPLGNDYFAQIASQQSQMDAKMALLRVEVGQEGEIAEELLELIINDGSPAGPNAARIGDFAGQILSARTNNLDLSNEDLATMPEEYRRAIVERDAENLLSNLRNALAQSNSRYERLLALAAFKNFVTPSEMEERISNEIALGQAQISDFDAASRSRVDNLLNDESAFQHFMLREYNDLVSYIDPNLAATTSGQNLLDLPEAERSAYLESLAKQEFAAKRNSSIYDTDFSFSEVMPEVHSTPDSWIRKSPEQRLRSMVKAVFTHEVGHFLGLGHNFEENILPKEGTVPQTHYEKLKKNADKYLTAFSTVMGYSNGRVYVSMDEDEIVPGPQDVLSLRYLYNQEYPVWNGVDKDFTEYKQVANDGTIPPHDFSNPELKTTYFPNCNDYEAIFAASPYCRRFARGYDATTIVNAYFEGFNQNWIAKINNFGGVSESDAWSVQRYLWARSFELFNDVRQFYDLMRTKYSDEIDLIKNNNNMLEDFSRTCKGMADGNSELNPDLVAIFQNADPEFAELCRVNAYAIEKMQESLEERGPDFPVIDHDNTSIPTAVMGGDAYPNYGRWNGTWVKAGLLPTKINAISTLNSPYPYVYWSWRWAWPIPRYAGSGKAYSYLYSTLYPAEYTEAMSSVVRNNIMIRSSGDEANRIQRSVLALGNQRWTHRINNERQRGVDGDYLRTIEDQTKFNSMGYVVLILKGQRPKGDGALPNRIESFQASLYDFGTREFIKLGDAYVLQDAKIVISSASENEFVYPISKMRFYSDDNAFAYGIRVTFSEDDESSLWTRSTKEALRTKYKDVLASCLDGSTKNGIKNGIQEYFNPGNKSFEGFIAKPNIAINNGRFKDFKKSVDKAFDDYLNSPMFADNPPSLVPCTEAVDGLATVVMSALAVQGWITGESLYYIEY